MRTILCDMRCAHAAHIHTTVGVTPPALACFVAGKVSLVAGQTMAHLFSFRQAGGGIICLCARGQKTQATDNAGGASSLVELIMLEMDAAMSEPSDALTKRDSAMSQVTMVIYPAIEVRVSPMWCCGAVLMQCFDAWRY